MDEEKLIVNSFIVGVVLIFMVSCITYIGPGETAVQFHRFKGMTNRKFHEGINLKNPITDSVTKYSLKVRLTDYEKIEGMSSDNQTITMHIATNWKYQPDKLKDVYTKIVGNIEDTIMLNIVNETTKSCLGKVQIGEIAKNREGLRIDMENTLRKRMAEYYVDIVNLSVVNVEYSGDFEKAVEAKQVAQQKSQEAEYNKQAKIREAEGQARSNQLLQQSATKQVIALKYLERWDGKLPQVISNAAILRDLSAGTAASTSEQ